MTRLPMRKTKELILAVAMIAAVITPAAGEESHS